MFPIDIMRQLMTQRLANNFIIPIPIIRIRAQPQLDHLAAVAVEAERAASVRGVLGGVHFCEDADGEAVRAHADFYTGVGGEAGEEAVGAGGVGEVGEGEDGVEGVGCFVGGFAPVMVAGGGGGLEV